MFHLHPSDHERCGSSNFLFYDFKECAIRQVEATLVAMGSRCERSRAAAPVPAHHIQYAIAASFTCSPACAAAICARTFPAPQPGVFRAAASRHSPFDRRPDFAAIDPVDLCSAQGVK